MLNNNIRLTGRKIEEANAAYDNYVKALATLEELGFEVVQNLDKVIDTKPIIINKGKIVAVDDPKDEEEIDELYREIGRHLGRINQLTAENEELRDKVEHQNVLHDEQMEKDLDRLYEENRRHIRRIEQLANENEQLTNDVNELKAQLTKEEAAAEEQETMKGGDAVETVSEEKPKRNPLLDKIKKAKEFTLEEAAREAEAEAARKAQEKEEAKSKFPKYTLEYEQITFDKTMDSKTMFGVRGTITFDEASYFFEATNNHHMPIVYGCYDEDVIRLTKDILMHEIERFSFMNERERSAADYRYAKDETFPIVAWRLTDDKGNVTYHGYSCTKQYSYLLTWDKAKFNYVGRKLVKHVFTDAPNLWKKLSNAKLADKFRAVCASIWPEDFTNDDNDPEPTKDKNATRVTKEQHQHTNEFFHVTKEQHESTNDETVRVTKEQHQTTNEIIWDTPIDDFECVTNDFQNTKDEEFDAAAADLDF